MNQVLKAINWIEARAAENTANSKDNEIVPFLLKTISEKTLKHDELVALNNELNMPQENEAFSEAS